MSTAQQPKWKEKLSFLDRSKVEHTVNGARLNFYPVSVGVMIELRGTAKLIGSALAVIFDSTKNDAGTIQRQFASDAQKGVMDSEIVVEGVRPEIVALRQQAKQKAVQDVIEAVTNPDNVKQFGDLIMNSLREVFPPGNPDNPPGIEFMRALSLPDVVEMLVGVAKANKGVFGPLADRLGKLRTLIDGVLAKKLAEVNQNDGADDSIPGSSFKINSSGSSSESPTASGSSGSP